MTPSPRPQVIVSPHPRTIGEIFDATTWRTLNDRAEVVWGRDEPMPQQRFDEAIATAAAVVFGVWPGTRDAVRAAPVLTLIAEVLGSFRHPELDFDSCFERDILVASAAPAFGPVVAEMCLGLTLASMRNIAHSDRHFRSGDERYLHAGNEGARTLLGATVGFVGCGSIARTLQALLGPFGVAVLGYDPWIDEDALRERGIEPVPIVELFDRSDVVYVLAAPTPDNAGLVSRDLMSRLGPADVLIVGSRAHLVDFDALTDLVVSGRFRAGIDVFPDEPLAAHHPIRSAEGAVLTAHLAGAIPAGLHAIGRIVTDDLLDLLGGIRPSRLQLATPELVARLRNR